MRYASFLNLVLYGADIGLCKDPDIEGRDFCDINKVSELVLFLSSDAASIVNGATWTADAGITAA